MFSYGSADAKKVLKLLEGLLLSTKVKTGDHLYFWRHDSVDFVDKGSQIRCRPMNR